MTRRKKSDMVLLSTMAALSLVLVAGAAPNEDLRVAVSVSLSAQEEPLQVTGFRLPQIHGRAPIVILRNTSQKEIKRFVFDVVEGSADEFVAGPGRSTVSAAGARWHDVSRILPGATYEFEGGELDSTGAMSTARLHKTTCLHELPLVTEVEFADGTTWKADPFTVGYQLWKGTIRPDDLRACQDPSATQTSFGRLKGTRFIAGQATHAAAGIVKEFSYTCALEAGKATASCQI